MKNEYKPKAYHFKNAEGKPVNIDENAEFASGDLQDNIWKEDTTEKENRKQTPKNIGA